MDINVQFYAADTAAELRYAVVAARCGGQWVLSRHRERDTWELPGGHREPGEDIDAAARRELYEETGIQAEPEEFELLDSDRERNIFYDHYCLFRRIPLKSIVLQPGETDNVMWASFGKVDWMIRTGKMCRIIGHQFYRQEKALRLRNMPKFGR